MKTLVTYMTATGNTQMIAEAIFEAVKGDKEIKPMAEVEGLDGYDLVFAGFPVNMAGAPKAAKDFLQSKAEGRKLALFITHAMASEELALKPILENCRAAASKADIVGVFDCQGVLEKNLAEKLLKSPDANMRKFGEERYKTVGHPDARDRARARHFAEEISAINH